MTEQQKRYGNARIITWSGTHGSGKTVAMYRQAADMMCAYPSLRIDTITGVARAAKRQGFKINQGSTGEAQLWIFTTLISNILEKSRDTDIVLCDRSIYDVIAYPVIGAKDYSTADWMLDFAKKKKIYEQVIFHPAEQNEYCHGDGLRDTDLGFRYEIDRWLRKFYAEYDISIIEHRS